ncbi:LytR/AlgR family response regulator transcription factor [Chryseobacterium defluvii]|uniref:LytTR family two component transcriptional regulator n=1 Tax=Chryseobacterium defluvii TaxID=160396 RepID=A0A495S8K1_9FLAO|nr:LytTR family DNA-binding domain-containing protein [Chryseobacterium defluvii]RKS95969.1 LytTR family two component transcriptional regulator [Chryseobacterium defluvii]
MELQKKYNCLIVEDEPIAAEIIENYILRNDDFRIIGKCSDAVHAANLLSFNKPDLLFLDMNLPVIKGFDFLKKLNDPPFTIVTTAYQEYALEGYDFDIVDYLMKPVSYERFQTALNKFRHLAKAEEALLEATHSDYIFLTIRKKQFKIYLEDIYYIESFREYITVHTKKESITVKMPISKMENMLSPSGFIRIHKSYIVSLKKIEGFSAAEIIINNKKLPIGRTYKNIIKEIKI